MPRTDKELQKRYVKMRNYKYRIGKAVEAGETAAKIARLTAKYETAKREYLEYKLSQMKF